MATEQCKYDQLCDGFAKASLDAPETALPLDEPREVTGIPDLDVVLHELSLESRAAVCGLARQLTSMIDGLQARCGDCQLGTINTGKCRLC